MNKFRTSAAIFAAIAWALVARVDAASTISASNKWAWAANSGWVNCLADVTNGMEVGEFVCSGYWWSTNVGWICLGNGNPTNGVRYTNVSSNDYGVNHSGAGVLRGFAWSDSIGWINFEDTGAPKIDLKTGMLSGYAWGGSMGWISFTNIQAFSQSTNIASSADSDLDGIPDQWEMANAGNLTDLGNPADPDYDDDGVDDVDEYGAGTNPKNDGSLLKVTNLKLSGSNVQLSWLTSSTRVYKVETRPNLLTGSWTTNGTVVTTTATSTTSTISMGSYSGLFYRIKACLPFSQ